MYLFVQWAFVTSTIMMMIIIMRVRVQNMLASRDVATRAGVHV